MERDTIPHKNNDDKIKCLCYCHWYIKINNLSYYECKHCGYKL